MTVVTSAEAQKNFGRYRERALAEPVVVTQYGKPSVVIISAAEYERLKELDRRVMRLDNMSDAEIEEMLDSSVPPEQRYSISEIEE
jgi:prevent-host-death family protein